MSHPRPADQAGGEDAGVVALLGLLDAVGGHEDRAGECVELFSLVLPRASVVADQVLVSLQARVGEARKHFAVGINVDALALCLLE